jgi:hypothetical protein
MVVVGPIEPPYALQPRPHFAPIWPSSAFVATATCPICHEALANGEPLVPAGEHLAHAACLQTSEGT